MKTIELKNGSVTVPESWDDVTLKQQLTYEGLYKSDSDFKMLGIVAGYCNMTMEEVKKLPINDVKTIFESLEFIKTPIENKPITEFKYNDESFSIVQTMLKAEAQDFISLETLLENYKEKEYLALPYIIAILAKKKVGNKFESLSDFDLEERAKYFEDLPITIANGIWFFFAQTARMYTVDFQKVLEKERQNINQSINSILNTPTKPKYGGIFMGLLRAILRSYLKFLQRNWNRYYSGLNLDKGKLN